MKKTKAEKILEYIEEFKPDKAVSIGMYNGKDILEAQAIENYAKAFLRSGDLMPLPLTKKYGLDVHEVQSSFDKQTEIYHVTADGIVKILKGVEK